MYACPVCNGFYNLSVSCSCGFVMQDTGRLEEYADAYSPYQDYEEELFPEQSLVREYSDNCVHLLSCSHCRKDERVTVALIRT